MNWTDRWRDKRLWLISSWRWDNLWHGMMVIAAGWTYSINVSTVFAYLISWVAIISGKVHNNAHFTFLSACVTLLLLVYCSGCHDRVEGYDAWLDNRVATDWDKWGTLVCSPRVIATRSILANVVAIRVRDARVIHIDMFFGDTFHKITKMVNLLIVDLSVPYFFITGSHVKFDRCWPSLVKERYSARGLMTATGLWRDHPERIRGTSDSLNDFKIFIHLMNGSTFLLSDLPGRYTRDIYIIHIDIGRLQWSCTFGHEGVSNFMFWRLLFNDCWWL